jgi:hypothetical protein
MKKFEKMIARDGDKVMADRANSISQLAEMAQVALVNRLEKTKIELEMKKKELLDMSPDNRYSLRPGENFKADAWIADYQSIGIAIINNKVELGVAQATMTELFSDESQS